MGKLHLYSFEGNLAAREFYAEHGFSMMSCGLDNEEGLADLMME